MNALNIDKNIENYINTNELDIKIEEVNTHNQNKEKTDKKISMHKNEAIEIKKYRICISISSSFT